MKSPLRLCCCCLLLTLRATALQLPPRPSSTRGAFVRDALATAGLLALPTLRPAAAAEEETKSVPDRIIGEIPASGLVFRDYLKVSRFDDPKVQGVKLYVSDFQLPMTERLASGDPFSDPASTAVTCVKTGPVKLDPTVETSSQGEEVFSQARSLLFKSVKARRPHGHKRAVPDGGATPGPPLGPATASEGSGVPSAPERRSESTADGTRRPRLWRQLAAERPSIQEAAHPASVPSPDRPSVTPSVTQVRRLYDVESGTLVYVSYSDRLNKNDDENKTRFKSALCVVKID